MSLARSSLLLAALLAGAGAASDADATAAALAADSECSGAGNGTCSLSALQRAGRLSSKVQQDPPEGEVAAAGWHPSTNPSFASCRIHAGCHAGTWWDPEADWWCCKDGVLDGPFDECRIHKQCQSGVKYSRVLQQWVCTDYGPSPQCAQAETVFPGGIPKGCGCGWSPTFGCGCGCAPKIDIPLRDFGCKR